MTTPDPNAVVLPSIGPICYGMAQDILEYKVPRVGAHLPGVYDVGLWSTDQLRAAVLAERERRAAPSDGAMRFAGWFREIPSAMNYRLWEQGGPEQSADGRDVALYERCEP